uniref:Peptidase M50B-like protein n=1 Tax=Aureoumbra lagunensis TaxID=44058 RepID=A0A7S3JNK1_9STRA|mmetsp:Transcript_21723/g.28111  ORF Transcript_21723/g.28111 Transcript_21723/m.28111 type:complete len:245 (+) Transcript_21723:163-897(+)
MLLPDCCRGRQVHVLIAIAIFVFFDLITWRVDYLSKPFKLLAVFVHEASHASACFLTGGSVSSLEVNINEGGTTKYSGGYQRIITPAGYIGGAFWGAVGLCCVATTYGQYILTAILATALVITLFATLFCSRNNVENPFTTGLVCIFFVIILVALILLHVFVASDALLYGLLFIVTYISLFSSFDIYDDCVRRYVKNGGSQSDAVVCERLCPILPARGHGCVWFLISLAFWFLGICLCLSILDD